MERYVPLEGMERTGISSIEELAPVLVATDPIKNEVLRALAGIERAERNSSGSATQDIEDLLWHFAAMQQASERAVKMLAVHLAKERGVPVRQVAKLAQVTHTTINRWSRAA